MEELKKKIINLAQEINEAVQKLKLAEKRKELEGLKEQISAPDFWQNKEAAQISAVYRIVALLIKKKMIRIKKRK